MCLIPTEVIRTIGLSLPVFIKWDDAEYGLRARAHGFPTVSLPGAAVWHVSWGDKDDLVGWQSYFHERNRLITALLYSLYERGGRVLRSDPCLHDVRRRQRADRPGQHRLGQEHQCLVDLVTTPAAAVLVVEQHQPSLSVHPGVAPRVLQQHQCQ